MPIQISVRTDAGEERRALTLFGNMAVSGTQLGAEGFLAGGLSWGIASALNASSTARLLALKIGTRAGALSFGRFCFTVGATLPAAESLFTTLATKYPHSLAPYFTSKYTHLTSPTALLAIPGPGLIPPLTIAGILAYAARHRIPWKTTPNATLSAVLLTGFVDTVGDVLVRRAPL